MQMTKEKFERYHRGSKLTYDEYVKTNCSEC